MNKISKYNDFLLEKQFNSIIDDIFRIVEDVEGKWTSSNTMEWDYSNEPKDDKDELTDAIIDFGERALNKLRDFLKKLPKEKIKEYYVKMINKFKSLPETLRRKLIGGVTGVFLTFVSLTQLLSPSTDEVSKDNLFKVELNDTQKEEIIQVTSVDKKVNFEKSSFEKAQGLVQVAEAGYSDDRDDTGNYIDVPGGKRFIGTNHGISAPILDEYFKRQGIKRLLTKDDMINLSYETALKIYKSDYWDAQNLGELSDQNVANVIYDGCVNQGVGGMDNIIKKAAAEQKVNLDGKSYSKSNIEKINGLDQVKLFKSIKKFREERYKNSETFNIHGEGWLNRLDNISYVSQETNSDRT
jgi:lysozyme family protein